MLSYCAKESAQLEICFQVLENAKGRSDQVELFFEVSPNTRHPIEHSRVFCRRKSAPTCLGRFLTWPRNGRFLE